MKLLILQIIFGLTLIILLGSLTGDLLHRDCEQWEYTYQYRGRLIQQTLCGDTFIIADNKQLKPLPEILYPLQDDIAKQYYRHIDTTDQDISWKDIYK